MYKFVLKVLEVSRLINREELIVSSFQEKIKISLASAIGS